MQIDTNKENEYIKKIQNGDFCYFSNIIKMYQDRLFTFIYYIVKNHDDARDLTQDVLFKAYRKIKSFKFRAKFSTWLFQIGYNQSINFINKKKRRQEIEENLPLSENYPAHEEQTELAELNDIINVIIDSLDSKSQAVLYLFYKQDKKYYEIADIMNIPINTVKSYIYRGKEKIKKELENNYKIDIENTVI